MSIEHQVGEPVCLDNLIERSTGRNLNRAGEGVLIGQLHDAIIEPVEGGNRLGCQTDGCERTCDVIAVEGQLAVAEGSRVGECFKLAPPLGQLALV